MHKYKEGTTDGESIASPEARGSSGDNGPAGRAAVILWRSREVGSPDGIWNMNSCQVPERWNHGLVRWYLMMGFGFMRRKERLSHTHVELSICYIS